MTEKRFTTGDYGKGIKLTDNVECEHYFWINEHDCEDLCTLLNELYDENQRLKVENEQLKSEIKDLNDVLARYEEKEKLSAQPNCHKCIEYSRDNVGDYCMSEDGLLGSAWEMFPLGWDYGNAKDCKEYDGVR